MTPAGREKIAAQRRKDWRNPAYRARMTKKMKAAWKRGREQRTKYGNVGARYAFELKCFSAMFDRVKCGQSPSIEWTRSKEDFLKFLRTVGAKPVHMKRPTIGRKDHFKGYGPRNVVWEEFSLNSAKKRSNQHKFKGK